MKQALGMGRVPLRKQTSDIPELISTSKVWPAIVAGPSNRVIGPNCN